MKIHREGIISILTSIVTFLLINILVYWLLADRFPYVWWFTVVFTSLLLMLVTSFFRAPTRQLTVDDRLVIAPCDGKVVVIEEVCDTEYFNDKCLQVSIFMSVLNVHVNRNPIDGTVIYKKYHPGKYLFAWHPKSSTENERYVTVYKHKSGKELLAKQIAGALAKRIVNYLTVSGKATQSEEMGFIKFGSRMDILLPLDAEVLVKLGDKPKGGVTPIAKW